MPIIETTVTTAGKVFFNSFLLAISTFMFYLGIDVEAFTMFSVLLVVDYATGLMKARAINESITSNKMKYGVASKLSLVIIPIVLAVGGKAMCIDITNIIFVSVNLLVLSELYSIISNVYAIRTKEELPEYDVVSIIGRKIKYTLIKFVGGN